MNYITADQRQQMIKGYNALVDDFMELGIGHMPYMDEASHNDVEALFIFKGLIASELINYIRLKEDDYVEKVQLHRSIKKRKRSTSTREIEGIL